ncbi:MAG: CoA-binding protein [Victivallaceae bacterium]|nr:CoA-binding protein [Victivallaceae bacterium]
MRKNKTVAVLGASPKPERYSNQAVGMLLEYGYEVIPVNPSGVVIHGLPVIKSLDKIKSQIGTLTMYVSAKISSAQEAAILQLNPARVIFNPGTENPALETALANAGIKVVHACTLVLLRTGQFEDA